MRYFKRIIFYGIVAVVIFSGLLVHHGIYAADHIIVYPSEIKSSMTWKERTATNIANYMYGDLNKDIKEVVDILQMNPDSNSKIWNMIKNVSDAIVPIGFSIAAIFILISFLNKAMLFQFRSYEDVAKVLLFMMLAKVVLSSSFEILGFIYSATANLITAAAITPESITTSADKAAMIAEYSKMGTLELLSAQASILPSAMIMGLIKVAIKVVAYGRLFEIYIYTAVAALPLATVASTDLHHIAKKFIQSYVGVCLQGFVMLLSCVIFSALAIEFIDPSQQDTMMGGGGFMLASLVLLFVLVKSGTWGKQIAGLA